MLTNILMGFVIVILVVLLLSFIAEPFLEHDFNDDDEL